MSARAQHRRAIRQRMFLQLRRARGSAFIVAAGIALAILSAMLLVTRISGGVPVGGKERIRVAVTDAKGVQPGKNEVRWAGVVVGRITDAKLEHGRAVLSAELDPGTAPPLYRDARLRLRPATPLNDMYLDVERRGTRAAGELRSGEVLAAARTRSAVDVAEVLNVFSEDVRDRLEQALDELAVGLPDGGDQLRAAFVQLVPFLASTKRVADAVSGRDRAVRRLVNRLRLVTDELAWRDRAITRLVRAGGATFGELGARRRDLDQFLRQLAPTLDQMQSSFGELDSTLGVVRPALGALRPAARDLPGGLRALDSFSRRATPALRALRPAVRALNPLARELSPTTAALDAAFRRLEPQLPRLNRITADVSRCELPLQKYLAWTMSVLKIANRSNGTPSPRGLMTILAGDATNGVARDLVPVKGCADGRNPR